MKTVKTTKTKTTTTAANPAAVSPAQKKAVKVASAKAPAAPTARPTAVPTAPPRREITTELIAARAYILWEKQGRPLGNDLQNWLLAESQLKQEIQSFTA